MKNLNTLEIQNNLINAVQSEFDRRESQGEELEDERKKEKTESSASLKEDLEYLIKKHGLAFVFETLQELVKPTVFIMTADFSKVSDTSVVVVTGETANNEICKSEKQAKQYAVEQVAARLKISPGTCSINGKISYTNINSKYGNITAIFFKSENKKTGQKASVKVGWYK